MLETVPSFSIFNTTSSGGEGDDKEQEQQADQDKSGGESLERTVTIGESTKKAAADNEGFSFGNNTMGLIKEGVEKEEEETYPVEEAAPIIPPMYCSPVNSDVLAAYASFLWSIEDGEDESAGKEDQTQAEIEKQQVDQYVEAEPELKGEKWNKRSRFLTGLRVDIANMNENQIISEGGKIG